MPGSEEKEISDWDLVNRARDGDEAAFSEIIARYQRPIHSFIYRSVGSESLAADLAQEAFVRAWFALPKVRATGTFSTWLFQIAINLCRDHAKSRAARNARVTESLSVSPHEDRSPETDLPSAAAAPDEMAAEAEALALLEREIRALPENLREPFLLGAVEGHSQKEVGEMLGLSAKSVEVKIYRARKLLMEKLGRSRV